MRFGAGAPNENPQALGAFKYNLRFPGQYYDQETGQYYNYHRDYDPLVGRYVESDPGGLRGGLNTYVYVADSPVDGIDLFGRYRVHGNWCGPDWTGGFKSDFNNLTPSQRRNVKAAVDPVDAACEKHDKCYAHCRDNIPCSPDGRSACFADCDLTLYGAGYSRGFWGYVVGTAMDRGGKRDSGPNDKSCPGCGK